METFGECSVNIGGVQRILRADAEIEASGLDTAVEANMDGSVYQTAKTAAATLKLSLQDELDLAIDAREQVTPRDVTFVEEQNGRTHIYSNAKIVGKPLYNPATGAITNITYACSRADYRRQNG